MILRPPVIASALGRAGTRAGVPDLALDSGLVDRLELDGQSFLASHSTPPPLAAQSRSREWIGRNCANPRLPSVYYIIILK